MKKNVLKYGLILLSMFLFCTNVMSQDQYYPCDGSSGYGTEAGIYHQTSEATGVMACPGVDINGAAGFCLMTSDQNTLGGDCYWVTSLPLGNGVILLMLLVTAYGGFVYYRRRSTQAI